MSDAQWFLARTRSGEHQTWLAGFDESGPVWVASVDKAVASDRKGAEAARLRCTDLPDHDDVFYAVCHLKTGAANGSGPAKTVSDFTADMLDSARELSSNEDRRQQIAKRIS